MRNRISLLAIASLLAAVLAGCTTAQTQGGLIGAGVGGLAGALIDHKHPWRGGVIGAGLGAVMGATLGDIADQGARQAASSGRPVEYRTEDRRGVYRADPMEYDANTNCRKVRERIWEDGRPVKDQVREVCESTKRESGYDNYDSRRYDDRRYDDRRYQDQRYNEPRYDDQRYNNQNQQYNDPYYRRQ